MDTEVMLTIIVTLLALVAMTGWACALWLLWNMHNRIDDLALDSQALDADIAQLWQATFPRTIEHQSSGQVVPFQVVQDHHVR